jgi:ligand-binding sensor domain-containing protein
VFNKSNGLISDYVYVVFEDTSGQIWAGTNDGGVFKFDKNASTFKQEFDLRDRGIYDVTAILQTANGHYWFAGYGLLEYDPKSQEFTSYSTNDNFPAHDPLTLAIGKDDALYIGTLEEGLIRYADGDFTLWTVPNVPRYAAFSHIVPATDGSLYFVEQYWNSVDQFDPASGQWETPDYESISIPRAVDSKGYLWSGAYDGLWIFSPAGSRTHFTTKEGLPSDNVNDVALDASGNAWIATDGGLAAVESDKVTSVYKGTEIGLVSDIVKKVFVDSNGNIWAAGEYGGDIARFEPGGKQTLFTAKKLFDSEPNAITGFAEDANGDLLVATDGDGLYRRSPSNVWNRITAGDPGVNVPVDNILCVSVAPDGSIWLGLKDRAARFDGEKWQSFTTKEGMSGRAVYDIYFASDGTIWFATDGGVTRIQP